MSFPLCFAPLSLAMKARTREVDSSVFKIYNYTPYISIHPLNPLEKSNNIKNAALSLRLVQNSHASIPYIGNRSRSECVYSVEN